MDAVAIPKTQSGSNVFTQIRSADLPCLFKQYPHIKTVSLDCFDTLLWRLTASPKDVFYRLQQQACFQRLGVTAYQRINAAALAYRMKFAAQGMREIKLDDIYRQFTSLTQVQRNELIEAELQAESELCYAFPPFVDFIRQAKEHHLNVIIVSDTYLTQCQLRQLLAKKLPADVMDAISIIFCSSEFGKSKSTGLFTEVVKTLETSLSSLLHIGDHAQADFTVPRNMGIQALHFLQFDVSTADFLRTQHTAAALSGLTEPNPSGQLRLPRYSPFRGLFATATPSESPESLIGYLSFGPILYAFAQFISDEIRELEQQGKRLKVFFLMRDAYLLSLACETFAGKSLGKPVRIRKFVTVAASFRSRNDVDCYLASLTPQYYNFHVICEQLLLPAPVTAQIIQMANASSHPENTFNELIHRDEVLELVFKQSTAYRQRLKRYIQKEMGIESGDTVVLVDMGYVGTTQKHLTLALQEEFDVEITGRYLIASHEPDRPECKALITTTACDHGLFEQSCTYKEGAVLNYDQEGNPVFDVIRLGDAQYAKVHAIQQESLRFIRDAKKFFASANLSLPFSMLQASAMTALHRHVYLPLEAEVAYFQSFQHDKDMGPALTKTMYNVSNGLNALRQSHTAFHLHPYEARVSHLETAFCTLLQKTFQLELTANDMSLHHKMIRVIAVQNNAPAEIVIKANPTHDGYFSFFVPAIQNAQMGVLFGQHFHWLQIDSIQIAGHHVHDAKEMNKHFAFNHMENRGGNLFECTSDNGLLLITPIAGHPIQGYQIVFRPVIERPKQSATTYP